MIWWRKAIEWVLVIGVFAGLVVMTGRWFFRPTTIDKSEFNALYGRLTDGGARD